MKLGQKIFRYASLFATGAYIGLFQVSHAFALEFKLPTYKDGTVTPTDSNAGDSISAIATKVIDVLLVVSGVLAVLYLIWSGIQYITSAGNADRAKVARAGIINAIIGIVIILAAFFIVRFATSVGQTVQTTDGASN